MKNLKLKYKSPAKTWFEALPLGNGKLGAMVFSGIKEEKIGLNLDTLWSGDGHYKGRKVDKSTWKEVQKSIIEEDYTRAEELVRTDILCDWSECFLPAGDIELDFLGDFSSVNAYKRELSLEDAVHKMSFQIGGKTYLRESFASLRDNVIIMKISVEKEGGFAPLSFSLGMGSKLKYSCADAGDDEIFILGRAPVYAAPDYVDSGEPIRYADARGMRFALGLKVVLHGGSIEKSADRLVVNSDRDCYIIFSGASDFHLGDAYSDRVWKDIYQAKDLGYDALKARHMDEYKRLFSRVELSISASDETDVLALFDEQDSKDRLVELMFHYARYLMISSSMEGSEAANLQGIWNKDVRAPWSSNYTVNINTQMNYWFAESVNLSECHMPLFDLVDRTRVQGERTAKEMYHSDGWVSHQNVDIWGHSTPVGLGASDEHPELYSMWQMSAGWFCRHFWEHYLHSLDVDFLRNRAYPVIKGAVEFYLDNLLELDGYLGLIPSTSPENLFVDEDGKRHGLSLFSTMDTSILKDLFSYYLEMMEVLGLEEDERVREALLKLPPFKVARDGALAEWYYDYDEYDEHHRHISHLYGLYPAGLLVDDEDLLKACKLALEKRGDDGTGWSIAWKACLHARLKDGNRTFSLLTKQLNLTREERIMAIGGGTYPNLFCAHPPFQIDGNFGFAAAVVESLVQSHAGYIEILPALADKWKDGMLKGVILRGGYEVAFSWKDARVIELSIRAKKSGNIKIKVNGSVRELYLEEGRSFELSDI